MCTATIYFLTSNWNVNLNCRNRRKNTSQWNDMLRKVLRISYRDQIINAKIWKVITKYLDQHEHNPTTVKKMKLKWNGHDTILNGLAKMILKGTVEAGRWIGRQMGKKMIRWFKDRAWKTFKQNKISANNMEELRMIMNKRSCRWCDVDDDDYDDINYYDEDVDYEWSNAILTHDSPS